MRSLCFVAVFAVDVAVSSLFYCRSQMTQLMPQSFSWLAAAVVIFIVASGVVIAVAATAVAVIFVADDVDIVPASVVSVVFVKSLLTLLVVLASTFLSHDRSRLRINSSSNSSHRSCYVNTMCKTQRKCTI